jgi:hypothetical protein
MSSRNEHIKELIEKFEDKYNEVNEHNEHNEHNDKFILYVLCVLYLSLRKYEGTELNENIANLQKEQDPYGYHYDSLIYETLKKHMKEIYEKTNISIDKDSVRGIFRFIMLMKYGKTPSEYNNDNYNDNDNFNDNIIFFFVEYNINHNKNCTWFYYSRNIPVKCGYGLEKYDSENYPCDFDLYRR